MKRSGKSVSRKAAKPSPEGADSPKATSPAEERAGEKTVRLIKDTAMIAGILLISLVIYGPAMKGEFLWDDPAHITRPELRSWDGLVRIWSEVGATQQYYPVLHSAFWIQHRLWGNDPTPYHVANVLLHVTNCCLLAFLLRRIWRRPTAGPTVGSTGGWAVPAGTEWWVAGLWAVHPVCVESVAWISEQKNTLSTAFYLLAAYCYLDFSQRRRTKSYALAFVLFLLALGSKTMTVTLPPALLVVLWWRQGKLDWKRDVLPLLPWFAAAIAAGSMTAWVEKRFIGAEGPVFDLSILQRGLLAARIFWFYLGKLLWPVDLTFFYERWEVAKEAAGWTVHLITGVGVTVGLWYGRKWSRGPLAGWLLYAGSLFPALGFFNVFPFRFSYVADHFQYLASLSLLTCVAVGMRIGLSRLPQQAKIVGRLVAGTAVLWLCSQAHQQSRHYVSNEDLFRANIAENPNSWYGHHILAHTVNKKSPEHRNEAIALYRTALRLKEGNWDSHYKLGLLLVERAETRDEGIAHYREALRFRPDFPEALNGLANELVGLPAQFAAAVSLYERAVRLNPRFAIAHANLAQALARSPARQEEALRHFDEALRLTPSNATAHYHLANLLASIPGRQAEAIPHYEAVLRVQPNSPEAHTYLGNTLAQLGRLEEAKARWHRALQIKPDFEPARESIRSFGQMTGR